MSYTLSTIVTLQPVSRYIKMLGLQTDGKIAESKVIEVVILFYLLKLRPKASADNFTAEQRIDIAKKRLKPVSAKAIFLKALYLALMCLCIADQDRKKIVQRS